MSLSEQITQNMKLAMKAKNSATLSTLRLLLAAMKNKKIDVQHELSEVEIQDVVKSQVKQLKDSIESFEAGGRPDMAVSARAEIAVLEQYLPSQLSDAELEAVVKQAVAQCGAAAKADMGKAMGAAMAAVAGRADGSRVKAIVSGLLTCLVLVVAGLGMFQEASAAVPLVETFSRGSSYLEFMLRMVRVLVLWLGVAAVVLVLNGGFGYMIASSRDDLHTQAIAKMTHGVLATIFVAAVFAFCTVILKQIS